MYKFFGLIFCFGLFISSNRPHIVYQKDNIEVYSIEESNEHKSAQLANLSLRQTDSNYVVQFEINNYELKADSRNNLTGICANSKDGQHIHWIVDNKPYTALYQPEHKIKEDSGSHLVLAFLSRSHHQSIKSKSAFKLKQMDIGKKTKSFNLKKPYLFYSRPKGVYVGKDAQDILLDFYLVNTILSPKGNRVKIILDSVHSFTLYHWQPYLIRGLSAGDHKIKLYLLDYKNREIKTNLLPTERTFTLQPNP